MDQRNYKDHLRDHLEEQMDLFGPGIDPPPLEHYQDMSDEDLIEEAYSYAPLDLIVELHSRGIIITDYEVNEE